ncbi:cyclopropane-fatty-acyl-phospholipid synthase family protein [Kribbella sp.]|uniref:cyclopropane-fatty-acyl-phospholipid synthase family protein n=1 Tax=Kribbella sp. TaxID=1871183 RepID=UPI002D57C2C4|nr:cyclopropane-fatty-acyl-phospholipid synthase family protein [Kribbella sp.]HZX03675.1 cyclopropane-fatty-acyl-phospholipid synthase family protein [Kribbella sp.]
MTDLMPAVHQPVTETWPTLARPRSNPVRRYGAATAIKLIAKDLPATIHLDSNRSYGLGGPAMRVHRTAAFLDRLGHDAGSGFGEAYLAGDWDPEPGTDLADLLVPFAERFSNEETRHLLPKWAQSLRWLVTRTQPGEQENDRAGARENVSRHYDLSNAMFSEFLDPTLTYSAAYFPDTTKDLATATYDELSAAQLRKLDSILDAAGVKSGSRVLDIGCGWASLAIRAAQRGAWVTAITIASQQALLAQRRIAEAGVGDRVQVALRDYRDQIGEFDAVLSVEMIEAVGEKYWPVYFDAIERRLAPGGVGVVQAIVMPHERMLATRNTFTWVQKYIFPGGLIPSIKVIEQITAQHTGLRAEVIRHLGPDYARTLRIWRNRFIEQWPEIGALGFDDTFRRMWEFYLAYSEAGFRTGYLDDVQLLLTRR